MARINTYQVDNDISDNDIIIGSEYNGVTSTGIPIYKTKNYRIGDIGDFLGLSTNAISTHLGSFNSDGSFSYSSSFASQTLSTVATAGYAAATAVTSLSATVVTNKNSADASFVQVNSSIATETSARSSSVTQLTATLTNDYRTTTATNTQINESVATETSARASAVTTLNSSISIKPNILRATSAPSITQRITAGSGQSGAVTTAQDPAMGSLWIDTTATAVTAANGSVSQQPKNEFYVLQGSFGSAAWLKSQDASLLNTITSAATATSNLSTLTTADQARAAQVTKLNAQFTFSGGNINGVAGALNTSINTASSNAVSATASSLDKLEALFQFDGSGNVNGLTGSTIISSAIATSETNAVSTANSARATAQDNLVATISKVFRQNDAPAVTEPVNSIWYDTNDSNKSYVLVAGSPRVWTYTVDATRATSASVDIVSAAAANINGRLTASHGITVNAGGAVAGMKLLADGVTGSEIVFQSDRFKIQTGTVDSGTSATPFTVSGSTVSINGTLQIGGTTLTDVTSKANAATTASAAASAANSASKTSGAIGPVSITSTVLKQGSVAVASAFGHANTGFYFDNLGKFSLRDKLTVDASGNLSIAGAISATSGSISGDVTIGGVVATTVKNGAASGATANQSSNATIRAVGAATSGEIAGIKISGSELYQGAGNFNNADTGFYLGSNGTFSLKDKLSWNGTTLTINGNGTFSGSISAATGTFTGGTSGTGYTLNNSGLSLTNTSSSISLGNSVVLNNSGLSGTGFALTSAGLVATSGSFTGTINASGGTFSGALSSASGDFTGEITADEGTIGGWIIDSGVLQSSNSDVKINSGSGSSGIEMFNSGTLRLKISPTGSVTNPLVTGGVTVGNQAQEANETLTLNSSVFAGSFSNPSGNPTSINLRTSANAAGGTLFHNSRGSGTVGGATGATVGYTLVIPQNSGVLSVVASGTRTGWSISAVFGVRITTSSNAGEGTVIADHSFSVSSTGLGLPHSAQTFTGSFVAPSGNYAVHSYVKKIRIAGTLTTEAGENTNVSSVTIKAPAVTVSAAIAVELSELTSGGLLVSGGTNSFLRVDRTSSNSSSNPFIRSRGFMEHQGRLTVLNASGTAGTGDIYIGGGSTNGGGYLRIFSNANSHKYIDWYSNTSNVEHNFLIRHNGSTKVTITDGGSLTATGGVSSDSRLKQDIEYITLDATSVVKQLKPATFKYIDFNENTRTGFIAQDVLEILPNLVLGNGDIEGGSYGLDYDGILAIVVKGFKEQQTVIESQKTLIDNLTARVTALED